MSLSLMRMGVTVIVSALPGCISEGDTQDEALRNIREAIELYFEPIEDGLDFHPDAQLLGAVV